MMKLLTFPLYLYKKVPGQNPINNQNKLEFGFRVKHEVAKIQNKKSVIQNVGHSEQPGDSPVKHLKKIF